MYLQCCNTCLRDESFKCHVCALGKVGNYREISRGWAGKESPPFCCTTSHLLWLLQEAVGSQRLIRGNGVVAPQLNLRRSWAAMFCCRGNVLLELQQSSGQTSVLSVAASHQATGGQNFCNLLWQVDQPTIVAWGLWHAWGEEHTNACLWLSR